MIVLFTLLIIFVLFTFWKKFGRDKRGFNRKGIHKNGTRFDDYGYDVKGFDRDGYNLYGFDKDGYNRKGFDKNGYDKNGRNVNGKYNRFYDKLNFATNKEGFLNPGCYPVSVSEHAGNRMRERLFYGHNVNVEKLAKEAYAYGKSSYQVMKTSAMYLKEIENRYENGIALVYKGYIYIFSKNNTLITMYKNEKIIM